MNDFEKRRLEARKEAYDMGHWLDMAADCLTARGWIPWHMKPQDDALTEQIVTFTGEPGRTNEEIIAELRRLADYYYYTGAMM